MNPNLNQKGIKMIEISTAQFIQNPAHIQSLAEKEPVLLDNGKHKQVLMNYDDFLSLNQTKKPFVSLYDALVTNMPTELREALAQIDDDDDEPDDFSYIHAHRLLDTQGS